jgi:hypothetical protein
MVDVGFLSVSFDDLIEGDAQQESLLVSCVFSSYSVAGLLQLVIFCSIRKTFSSSKPRTRAFAALQTITTIARRDDAEINFRALQHTIKKI